MEKIVNILKEIRPEFDFTQSNDFISDGMLDSFDLITLISEIDKSFGISIDGLDIIPENFTNLETIKKLLLKYGVQK